MEDDIPISFVYSEIVVDAHDTLTSLIYTLRTTSNKGIKESELAPTFVQTLWDCNDIEASYPINMPFASNEAIIEILEMMKRVGSSQINKWDNLSVEEENNEKHPPSPIFRGFARNGAIFVQAQRSKDVDNDKQ